MGFSCGIVGLPNVGKSTIFNALTASALAQTANYPYCTIEPNSGRVPVPDRRLDKVAKIAKSEKTVPTYLEFVDIAGLVKGASKGEGLGNQFLGNIREVDAILHVLRCFEDNDIAHVDKLLDPVKDAEIVETELLLADLNSIDRQIGFLTKKAKSNERAIKEELNLLTRLLNNLSDGIAVRDANFTDVDENRIRLLNLLSAKPILYVCNVGEKAAGTGNELSERVAAYADQKGTGFVFISAKIEAEISQLRDEHEKIEFLETIGLKETGLARLIQAGYSLLNLITYYTAGPNEARAWTVAQGTRAHEAAGRIHSDFERGFICAETITGSDYLSLGGEAAARLEGKLRQEGKDYIIQEGDVILYRFNV